MRLESQAVITSKIETCIASLEALVTTERIIKIIEEEEFKLDNAKLVIEKAYIASEVLTVIVMGAKIFSPLAQNKLLKIIEEPPPNKAFVMITPNKATLLNTIRSRLPIVMLNDTIDKESLGLDVEKLTLEDVYQFLQRHQRTNAKEMTRIIERIATQAMQSNLYALDEKSLHLFSNAFIALDMGSPPPFVLGAVLLKLLTKKKEKRIVLKGS